MLPLVCSVIIKTERAIKRRQENNARILFSAAMVKMEKKQINLVVAANKLRGEMEAKKLELENRHDKLTCASCVYIAAVRRDSKVVKDAKHAKAEDVKDAIV